MRSTDPISVLLLFGCEDRSPPLTDTSSASTSAASGAPAASATSSSGVDQPCPFAGAGCQVIGIESSGNRFTMAIWSDGSTTCWGDDPFGFCALQHDGLLLVPTFVSNLRGVSKIQLGGDTHAAVTPSQKGLVWGVATHGERGDGVSAPAFVPTLIPSVPPLSEAHSGGSVTAVLDEEGRAGWWGTLSTRAGPFLQRGPRWEPIPRAVSVGASAAICAVVEDGGVFCWGDNRFGQLGDGTNVDRLEPARVLGMDDARSIRVSSGYACALREGGRVSCWGVNRDGQLGRGGEVIPGQNPMPYEPTPSEVLLPELAVRLSLGVLAACAIVEGGRVYCWGYNEENMFHSTLTHSATPVLVPDLTDVVDIAVGLIHLCVLKTDHTVWCRGNPFSLGRNLEGGNALGQVDFTKTEMMP